MTGVFMVIGAFIFLQESMGYPVRRTLPISAKSIEDPDGLGYSVSLHPKLDLISPCATITENGRALPFPTSSSQRVKSEGQGSFVFGAKRVWFSTLDGSDPRVNQRHYAIVLPYVVSPLLHLLGWMAWGLGIYLAIWAYSGFWLPGLYGISRDPHPVALPRAGTREWPLDVIRALAILLVLFHHSRGLPVFPEAVSPFLYHLEMGIKGGGYLGVDFFFVLSGYLVSGLLFQEFDRTGSIDIGRFLCRRGIKIYPAFWVMIGVSVLVGSMFPDAPTRTWNSITVDAIFGELVFLQNYTPGVWGHTWTLAVEEHFYLLLSLVFSAAVLGKRSARPFALVSRWCMIVAGACLAMRLTRQLFAPDRVLLNIYWTHLRLDSLFFGVWLRYWRSYSPQQFLRWSRLGVYWLPLCTVLLILPSMVNNFHQTPWITSFGFTMNYLAGGCLLLSAASWGAFPWLERVTRPLQVVGRHSYSIYLWHMLVAAGMVLPAEELLDHYISGLPQVFLYHVLHFALPIGMGILLGLLIEQPVLRLRNRWFPSRTAAPSAAPPSEQVEALYPAFGVTPSGVEANPPLGNI